MWCSQIVFWKNASVLKKKVIFQFCKGFTISILSFKYKVNFSLLFLNCKSSFLTRIKHSDVKCLKQRRNVIQWYDLWDKVLKPYALPTHQGRIGMGAVGVSHFRGGMGVRGLPLEFFFQKGIKITILQKQTIFKT